MVQRGRIQQYILVLRLEMETLKRLRLLARRDDWMVSFDLADGFYHVGIHEADRKYFQVAIAGQLYEFAALPMGWSLSPAIFCAVMSVWTTWARAPAAVEARAAGRRHAKDHRPLVFDPGPEGRACWRRLRRSGVRILPYVDDFLILGTSPEETRVAQAAVYAALDQLGIARHPTKGWQEPTQVLTHLGLEVDTQRGMFRVHADRAARIRKREVQATEY